MKSYRPIRNRSRSVLNELATSEVIFSNYFCITGGLGKSLCLEYPNEEGPPYVLAEPCSSDLYAVMRTEFG